MNHTEPLAQDVPVQPPRSIRTTRLSRDQITAQFLNTVNDAAVFLDVCPTILKRACRRYGISRWPQRKFTSLNNMAKDLAPFSSHPSAARQLARIAVVTEKLYQDPNTPLRNLFGKRDFFLQDQLVDKLRDSDYAARAPITLLPLCADIDTDYAAKTPIILPPLCTGTDTDYAAKTPITLAPLCAGMDPDYAAKDPITLPSLCAGMASLVYRKPQIEESNTTVFIGQPPQIEDVEEFEELDAGVVLPSRNSLVAPSAVPTRLVSGARPQKTIIKETRRFHRMGSLPKDDMQEEKAALGLVLLGQMKWREQQQTESSPKTLEHATVPTTHFALWNKQRM